MAVIRRKSSMQHLKSNTLKYDMVIGLSMKVMVSLLVACCVIRLFACGDFVYPRTSPDINFTYGYPLWGSFVAKKSIAHVESMCAIDGQH
jgi:hypothetical protein